MKFVVHKCYLNQLNLYNQVGLIAINVIGHPGLDDPAAPMAADDISVRGGKLPPRPGAGARAGAGINDLAVDMGMDPETAALLRDVNKRKDAAVASEDYELVCTCKCGG
jgi:centrosomal protein CEP104